MQLTEVKLFMGLILNTCSCPRVWFLALPFNFTRDIAEINQRHFDCRKLKYVDRTHLAQVLSFSNKIFLISDVQKRLEVCPDRYYPERAFCFYEFEWPCDGRCIPKSEVCDELDLGGCDAGMKRCGKDKCVDRNTPCNGNCWSESATNLCGTNMCLSKYQLEVRPGSYLQQSYWYDTILVSNTLMSAIWFWGERRKQPVCHSVSNWGLSK